MTPGYSQFTPPQVSDSTKMDVSPQMGRMAYAGNICYCIPGVLATGSGAVALPANTITYEPFFVESEITIDKMAFNVTTTPASNSLVAMGIYLADADWQPTGAPLVANEISVLNGFTGIKSQSVSLTLPRGRYLKALNCSVTFTARSVGGYLPCIGLIPTMPATMVLSGGKVTSAYATLPNTPVAWDTILTNNTYFCFLRIP